MDFWRATRKHRFAHLAALFERIGLCQHFPEVKIERLLKLCIIHDLGEAIGGDIPAIHQNANTPKAGQERSRPDHTFATTVQRFARRNCRVVG